MAEWLALEQLDLLAQVEAQVRSVHHTMRAIEKLRGGEHHVGPELSNGERGTVLTAWSTRSRSSKNNYRRTGMLSRDAGNR